MIDKEELPFKFRYTVDKLTLNDYLSICNILDEDEYPIVEAANGKKVRLKTPVEKDGRSEEHIYNLQQKVVLSITDLTSSHIKEPLLVNFCIEKIYSTFNNIESLLEDFDCKYEAPNYKEWCFFRWVLLEQRVSKGLNIMDGETVVDNIGGINWVLPMSYGSFIDDEKERLKLYSYFLDELPLKHSLKLFREQIKTIENIKKQHTSIYSSGGGGGGQNMNTHFSVFGWMETLRSLVTESAPFGNYKDTKNADLMEVLEFLNINSSYRKAENADINTKK